MAQRDEKLNFTQRDKSKTAVQWHSGMKSCSIAQRNEKYNFTYRCSNSTAEWKVELYLQLFNGTAGWNEKLNFTYRCSMAQRNEK